MAAPRPRAGAGRPALELRSVSRSFGDVVALDNVSISVGEGQLFGLVGPNGAGKTTAMRIVLGVTRPESGEVLWRGEPIDARVRKRFGYMPEERGLYPKMRVREQLSFFARLHGFCEREADDAARRWIERLGLAERADDRLETLSLGNQQRLQLAVALVHDPELLVLDEPFAGLDPLGVDRFGEVLRERARAGVSIVFSSHQLELVQQLCEAVAILERGQVISSGRVEALVAQSGRRVLSVCVAGATEGWWREVDGVELLEAESSPPAPGEAPTHRVRLALVDGAVEESVLDAARKAGRVTHFAVEQRSLTELFRETVEQRT